MITLFFTVLLALSLLVVSNSSLDAIWKQRIWFWFGSVCFSACLIGIFIEQKLLIKGLDAVLAVMVVMMVADAHARIRSIKVERLAKAYRRPDVPYDTL